ncbi:MAG: dihydrofolate reductase [Polyangiales bacterium]
MSGRPFALVVAADEASGIGKSGALPWHLPGELAHFRRLTTEAPEGQRNAVIMGRKTFDSIPPKFRPLPRRLNVVLSRDPAYRPDGAEHAASLDDALARLDADAHVAAMFVIGGGALYAAALRHPRCGRVYLTRVHATFACDTFLAPLAPRFSRTRTDGPHAEGPLGYTFEIHEPHGDAP